MGRAGSNAVRTAGQPEPRASGSRTWAGGQKEIHPHPSGFDESLGLPPQDRVFMGIWKQLGGSRSGDRYLPQPRPPAPTLRASFQGRRGVGGGGGHWDSQETLTCTETSARPMSFSAQHVTFFLLRSLVTLARVSPRDGRPPDCWVRKENGT